MSGFVNAISSGHGVHRSGRREFKLYNVLFFRLDAKEKIPKERIEAAFSPLLHCGEKLKGLELASLRQSPPLTLFTPLPSDAYGNEAGCASGCFPHGEGSIRFTSRW